MTATVTFLPGILPPDQLEQARAAERKRRETTRCADPKCRLLKPNHTWDCGTQKSPAAGLGDLGGDAA